MTRTRSFQTAAARRRLDPIVWTIDDVTVRLRASVDLADLADVLYEIQQPIPDNVNQIKAAGDKRLLLVSAVRTFVETADHDLFDRLTPDLDIGLLTDLLGEAIEEYTGQANPTSEPPSSSGS